MAFDISKVPPEDSRGFYYWRTNANPADIASYYKMKENLEATEEEEEVVSLASSFDNEVDPFEVEQTQDVNGQPWEEGWSPNFNSAGVDLNKVIEKNKYGGALKYSKLSPEDQAVVDARRVVGPAEDAGYSAYDSLGDMAAVNYGDVPTYDTPEEALEKLPSYMASLTESRKKTDEKFNLKNYDPSEFKMAGVSPVGGVSGQAAEKAMVEYLVKNDVPLSKEVDGKTVYLTTGLGSNVLFDILGQDNLPKGGGEYVDYGQVGQYSTVHEKPKSVLDNPILNVVAMAIPYGQAILAVTKGLAGETLKMGDYISIGAAALSYKGTLEGKTLAEAEEFATQKVNQAIDAAAEAGNAMTAAEATQLYNKTLASIETIPSVLGVTLSDVVDLKSGKIGFNDIVDNVLGCSFPELEAASKAAQNSGVPDGVIVNLMSDGVKAIEAGKPLSKVIDAFNIGRDVYFAQIEEKSFSEAEAAAKAESFKALDSTVVPITDINDKKVDITGITPEQATYPQEVALEIINE